VHLVLISRARVHLVLISRPLDGRAAQDLRAQGGYTYSIPIVGGGGGYTYRIPKSIPIVYL
jgi:hypothetical protein